MRHYLFCLMFSLLFLSCGGKAGQDSEHDTTYLEKPDSAGIIEIASVMERDLTVMLRDNDIQSAAALCQEGLDNIDYFVQTNDRYTLRIYTNALLSYIKRNAESIGDMATQNYIIKQFVNAVYKYAPNGGGDVNASSEPTAASPQQ